MINHGWVLLTSSGVGIFANDNLAPNNSAVLGDEGGNIGTLYCTSGLRRSNIGQWISPSGTEITVSSSTSFTVVHGGGAVPSYAGLKLKPGFSLMEADTGVYSCVILDEYGVEQILYVGIYLHDFQGGRIIKLQIIHRLLDSYFA